MATPKQVLDLDLGIYKQAKTDGAPFLLWLTDKVIEKFAEEGKDAQGRDIDVRADLESHVQRTLKRFGVPDDSSVRSNVLREQAVDSYGLVKEMEARQINPMRDTGAKFFTATANTPLFPAFAANTFVEARIASSLLSEMVYLDFQIDRLSYDKVRFNESADARDFRNVDIGGTLPLTELSQLGTNVPVRKYGRRFQYAREVVERSPLPVIQAEIARIAKQVGVAETNEAIVIAHAGDGETGSSIADTTPAADGTCAYADLITLENAFADGYVGRIGVCTGALFATIQNMAEYKDPLAARGVRVNQNLLALPTPSGAGLMYRWQSTQDQTYMYPSGSETGGRILLMDSTCAIYVVRIGDILQEQDDIISNGRREVAMSYLMAVVSGDPEGKHSLDVTA